MRFNANEHLKVLQDVEPDAYTAAAYNGAGIDRRGYEFATFAVNIGTMGTSATIDFKVQDSADNSTFADISGATITQQTQAGTDASDSIVTVTVNLAGQARYVRGVLTVGAAACDVGSVCVLSGPKVLPAA